MSNDLHTYTCKFRAGLSATATLDVQALREGQGKTQYVTIEWTGGKPHKRDIPTYIRWMLEIQQAAADLLPGRVLYWPIGSKTYYVLEPGKPWVAGKIEDVGKEPK